MTIKFIPAKEASIQSNAARAKIHSDIMDAVSAEYAAADSKPKDEFEFRVKCVEMAVDFYTQRGYEADCIINKEEKKVNYGPDYPVVNNPTISLKRITHNAISTAINHGLKVACVLKSYYPKKDFVKMQDTLLELGYKITHVGEHTMSVEWKDFTEITGDSLLFRSNEY